MRLRRWAGVIAVAGALTLATIAVAQGDPIQQGAVLYAENCAVCHGAQGEGRVGARLQDFPSINPKAFVKATVADGVPGSRMPAWSRARGGPLSEAEIDAIAAFIATWTTGDITPVPTEPPRPVTPLPTVAGVAGDPTRGAQVFQQNCAVCHGAKGEGRVGANLARPFASVFPAALVKQAVTEGVRGSTMPAWAKANGGPLTEQQVDDVTAFVVSMQKTTAPTFIEPTPTPTPALSGTLTTLIVLFVLVISIVVMAILSAQGARRSS